MPNPRWWQFEDGNVDLGNISADATDLAKVLVAEFALLYGNNWFVVPYAQRPATLAEIRGHRRERCVRRRTIVKAATGSSGGRLGPLGLLQPFGEAGRAVGAVPLAEHLLLPPVVPRVDDREPVESVAFVRDETTDMVWGVETRVPDGLGGGRDGGNAARRFKGALDQLEQSLGGNGTPLTEDPEAQLRYRAGTTVPENWIPLIPVHKPQDTREIRLQRAAMPRFFLGQTQPVRPTTDDPAPRNRSGRQPERPLLRERGGGAGSGPCGRRRAAAHALAGRRHRDLERAPAPQRPRRGGQRPSLGRNRKDRRQDVKGDPFRSRSLIRYWGTQMRTQ